MENITVKVLIRFKDKYTKTWHKVDDILQVDQKRYDEIKSFVKVLKNESPKKSKKGESLK